MNIRKLSASLPPGFKCIGQGKKIFVCRKGWEEVVREVEQKFHPNSAGETPGSKYLRGRGFPVVLPSRRGEVVRRRYRHGGVLRRLTRDLFWGAARPLNELKLLEEARQGEINVPEAVGLTIEKNSWGFARAALITLYLPQTIDLLSYCREYPSHPRREQLKERRAIIYRAAAQVARMHQYGIFHADLQLKNILLQKTLSAWEVYLLDFDKARRLPVLPRKAVLNNLLRLYRSFRKIRLLHPALSWRAAIRFLRAYAPADRNFRKEVVRTARRRMWQDFFHLKKWELSLKLKGDIYARPQG